ncbi:hypothetical protein BCR32DRAFT_309349 [Anaeromyces robustus]|nr:hypothetical protein BCR32DRAFT_309349 [Anaeromyces robustus]|eukprot:ORX82349.1 hypothetical protein BCR32DRAFT_309349 [Anaeromyces robustus]
MAHSMGGLYSVYWTNQYPEEILGFIGIDISISGMEDNYSYPMNMSIGKFAKYSILILKIFDILGITRIAFSINFQYIINIDNNYHYTEEEMNILRALALCRQNNKTLMKEGEFIDNNFKKLRGVKFPRGIPVLNFISSENTEDDSYWERLHYNIIGDLQHSEVILLHGQHYLHLDNKEIISSKIKEWISFNIINKKYYDSPIILQKEKDILLDRTLCTLKENNLFYCKNKL